MGGRGFGRRITIHAPHIPETSCLSAGVIVVVVVAVVVAVEVAGLSHHANPLHPSCPLCRRARADAAYHGRLKSVDPVWNQNYETRSPGALPDFNALHTNWERQQVNRNL
jgi:hypothetical protein